LYAEYPGNVEEEEYRETLKILIFARRNGFFIAEVISSPRLVSFLSSRLFLKHENAALSLRSVDRSAGAIVEKGIP